MHADGGDTCRTLDPCTCHYVYLGPWAGVGWGHIGSEVPSSVRKGLYPPTWAWPPSATLALSRDHAGVP